MRQNFSIIIQRINFVKKPSFYNFIYTLTTKKILYHYYKGKSARIRKKKKKKKKRIRKN